MKVGQFFSTNYLVWGGVFCSIFVLAAGCRNNTEEHWRLPVFNTAPIELQFNKTPFPKTHFDKSEKKSILKTESQANNWPKWAEEVLQKGRVEEIIPASLPGRTVKFYLYIKTSPHEFSGANNGSFLEGTLKSIFKLAHRNLDFSSPEAEVAAYLLARKLEFNKIPPARFRVLSESHLYSLLKKKPKWKAKARVFKKQVYSGKNLVRGAALYYLDSLKNFANHHLLWQWLQQNKVKLDKIQLGQACQLGKIIIYDYLIGNYDRFSGGNILEDSQGELYFIDHGAAFGPKRPWIEKKLDKYLHLLKRSPCPLLKRISVLKPAGVKRLLRDVLSKKQIYEIMRRKKKLLYFYKNSYSGDFYHQGQKVPCNW